MTGFEPRSYEVSKRPRYQMSHNHCPPRSFYRLTVLDCNKNCIRCALNDHKNSIQRCIDTSSFDLQFGNRMKPICIVNLPFWKAKITNCVFSKPHTPNASKFVCVRINLASKLIPRRTWVQWPWFTYLGICMSWMKNAMYNNQTFWVSLFGTQNVRPKLYLAYSHSTTCSRCHKQILE